jgi:hypothetical protein
VALLECFSGMKAATSRSVLGAFRLLASWSWLLAAALALLALSPRADAQPPPAASPAGSVAQEVGAWPKTVKAKDVSFEVYQPQPSAWDGYRLSAAAAVKAQEEGQETPIFGVIQLEASTSVNKDARSVVLEHLQVKSVNFPSLQAGAARYQGLLEEAVRKASLSARTLSLDRLESSLEIASTQTRAQRTLKNDPPRIVFADTPTLLIYIDGPPAWRPVAKLPLERVVNTRPLLLRDAQGTIFLKIFDGWLESKSLDGSWSVTLHPSPHLDQALKEALAARAIDPLTGTNPGADKTPPPSLRVNPPRVLVATSPTELIVTQGAPSYAPIASTELLYVENTTGNVFKHTRDQQTYLLIAGRWFTSASASGPWTFVAADQLPRDFAAIPDDSPKENVKASVAGTAQAAEAVIANTVPQTAKVDRKATLKPQIDGEPRFEPIAGTELQRVVNCATPILRIDDQHFFALENGVWFSASAVTGPWLVADTIPALIYTIPVSSPVYFVTYVRVYEATPTTVVVGYTPGYYGAYVYEGTVVYGTGYYYTPWVGSVWYGPPVTYGFAVGMAYTPWTGWAFAFGFGWCWGHTMAFAGWGWGPHPWWGPVGVGFYGPAYYPWRYSAGAGAVWGPRPGSGAAWGPGGWAASTGNVYHRWGPTTAVTRSSGGYDAWSGNRWSQDVGRSYNSRTGTLSAGQRSSVANVYSGNYQSSRSGASVNARTGGAVAGAQVTRGNAYTGNQVSAGKAALQNPSTGEINTAAGVRGENGAVARVGDDLYVSHDGNVARQNANGSWQQQEGGNWKDVDPASHDKSNLDRSRQQREAGARRSQGFATGAHRAAGFGRGGR